MQIGGDTPSAGPRAGRCCPLKGVVEVGVAGDVLAGVLIGRSSDQYFDRGLVVVPVESHSCRCQFGVPVVVSASVSVSFWLVFS